MKTILMTGATGFIGNAVGQKLVKAGHKIIAVSRSQKKALQQLTFPATIIECDLNQTALKPEDFKDVDCIINLAGETVDGKWTEEKKNAILNSRINTTKNLLKNKPDSVTTVITASAQGIYGHQGDRDLDENGPVGFGFLAEVCQQWEKPFQQLNDETSTRVVILRLGMVLSFHGGALKKLIPLFQKNIGATLGYGDQWVSWIHIDDVCQIFANAVTSLNYRGTINVSTDHPVQNDEFTEIMCKQLGVTQAPRVPEFALRFILGEMADLVLNSTKMLPKKLKGNGYKYIYPDLESALQRELKEFKNGQGFFCAQQYLPYKPEKVFPFFAEAENLEKITPDLLGFKIKSMSTPDVQQGCLIHYALKIHGIPTNWVTQIETWKPPYEFVDTQVKGPYSFWHHTHTFEPLGEGTLISDYVRYKTPMGILGRIAVGSMVQNDIETIFDYRRQAIAEHVF